MKLTKKELFDNLLTGSLFFGTGGGGSPRLAGNIYKKLIKDNRQVSLKKIDKFEKNDIFITGFTVGGLNQKEISENKLKMALNIFKKICSKNKIGGIIPVEIGPLSVALAAKLAQMLNLPLVDADFVGGRSTPEVFLETITLFNIKRTPLMAVDLMDNCAVLFSSDSAKTEEKFLRSFASLSGKFAFVLGYPISKKRASKSVCLNTVSRSIKYGFLLNKNVLLSQKKELGIKELYSGKIISVKKIRKKGFTCRFVDFESKEKEYAKLFIKNENLIFWINNKPIVTCPDLIVLMDKKNMPVYNMDLKIGMDIKVVALPCCNLWRSKQGLQLFNPKLFGYNFKPQLIN